MHGRIISIVLLCALSLGCGSSGQVPVCDEDTGLCDDAGTECSGDPDVDSDRDGICDSDDPCPFSDQENVDSDGDGVCDSVDACPNFPDGFDVDQDGIPAACDTCEDGGTDADLDGVPDPCDVCAGHDDALDSDSDGVPDGCDCDSACPADGACVDHPTGAFCACSPDDPQDAEPCIDAAPEIAGLEDLVVSAGRTVNVDFEVIEGHAAWADVELTANASTVAASVSVESPHVACPGAKELWLLAYGKSFDFDANDLFRVDNPRDLELLFVEDDRPLLSLSDQFRETSYFLDPMLLCDEQNFVEILEDGLLQPGVRSPDDNPADFINIGEAPGEPCEPETFCWNGRCGSDGLCAEVINPRLDTQPTRQQVEWVERSKRAPARLTVTSMSVGETSIVLKASDPQFESEKRIDVRIVEGCPLNEAPIPAEAMLDCTGAGPEEVCNVRCTDGKQLTNVDTGTEVSAQVSCGTNFSWTSSAPGSLACQANQPKLTIEDQTMFEDQTHRFGIFVEDPNDRLGELRIEGYSSRSSLIRSEGIKVSQSCPDPRRVIFTEITTAYSNDQSCKNPIVLADCVSEVAFDHRGTRVAMENLIEGRPAGGSSFIVCGPGRVVATEVDGGTFLDRDDEISSFFVPKLGGQECLSDEECLSTTCERSSDEPGSCAPATTDRGSVRIVDPERDDLDATIQYLLVEAPNVPDFSVTLTPQPDASGQLEITLVASDERFSTRESFNVTIEPDCERDEVPFEAAIAADCAGAGAGAECALRCIEGYQFASPPGTPPRLVCNGETFSLMGPTPPSCVLEPSSRPQDTTDGLNSACPALYWNRDLVGSCSRCDQSLGNSNYAAVDYSLNAYLEAANAFGLTEQPGANGCQSLPQCQMDRAVAHASANADASLFGERFTVVQGLFEGRIEGGRPSGACNCPDQPELGEAKTAVARADAELELLGSSIIDEHKELPGQVIAVGPYGYPVIPSKCVEEEIAGITVDACVELVAGVQVGVDVGPRFGIPQFVGLETDIVPAIGLFATGKAGLGNEQAGVSLTLEMDLVNFSLHNVASVDAFLGICDQEAPYIQLGAGSFLEIDLLQGRFAAEACLLGGCINEDWQVALPVEIPRIDLLSTQNQRIDL